MSGVPEPNPQHARSCVDLGLRMIRDIREVRAQRNNLNIDMRIGVHSGSIMSGVIGACKWQYDIWSKDVSIANRLETTGVPGYANRKQICAQYRLPLYDQIAAIITLSDLLFDFKFSICSKVHITKQTLDLLEDQYFFEPGTEMAKKDPVLIRNNIETFLISPQYYGGDFHVSYCKCNAMHFMANKCCAQFNLKNVCIQYYSPDELNRRYSSGVKRMMSRSTRNNVTYFWHHYPIRKMTISDYYHHYYYYRWINVNVLSFSIIYWRKFPNYSLIVRCIVHIILAKILCKPQWNSICKLWNKPIPKWHWSWTECRLENSSKCYKFWIFIWLTGFLYRLLIFSIPFSLSLSSLLLCTSSCSSWVFSFNHLFSSRRRDSCEDAEYERSSFSSKVSTILLRFRNKKWEMSFLHEQDLMLKYSTFMCFIVFIGIIVAQALNNP